MKSKDGYNLRWIIFLAVPFIFVIAQPVHAAISVEELAGICETMESAIYDMYAEYEWYVDPPLTLEDITGTGHLIYVGRPQWQWATARPFSDRSLTVKSAQYMDEYGVSCHGIDMSSYNGTIGKHLQISQLPGDSAERLDGAITKSRRFIVHSNVTPQGFTILRFHQWPLSKRLREHHEITLVQDIKKINGFNTICADFVMLTNPEKTPYLRVYFSVDHGYTPVRFERIRDQKVYFTVGVTELQKMAEGIWFPKSGRIKHIESKGRKNVYAASKIVVNQGLGEKDFDIEFPPGTKVRDEIKDIEYIVKSQ